jgi:hypothetical protein
MSLGKCPVILAATEIKASTLSLNVWFVAK